jgi:hypothetical protein
MPAIVVFEEYEVIPELTGLRLPKDIMLDILDRGVGERRNVNSNDPVTTPGTEMWRWCTRFCREDAGLKELGWAHCTHDKLEGIRNDDLRIKLVVVNTDARTGMISKQPQNVAEKGPAVEKLIDNNYRSAQPSLFDKFNFAPQIDPISLYDFWYFCVHASDKYVSAEISRPDGIAGGIINSFSKRLILCQPGEKPGLRQPDPIPEDFAEIDKPMVVRRG